MAILLEWSLRCQCCGSDSAGLLGRGGGRLLTARTWGAPIKAGGNTESQWFSNCVPRGLGCQEGWGERGRRWMQVPLPPLWEPQLQGGAARGVGRTLPSSTWQAQGRCSGRGECQHQGQPPPAPPSGSSDVPWEVGGLRPGAVLSQPLGSGEQTLSGGRRGGWIRVGGALGAGLHQAVFSQGYQDDRSYKQCRTSSPSSTGSVSLGRYTPTLRSPQHYSRPGTRPPRPLFPPREAGLLVAFPLMSLSLTLAPGETTDRAWDCQWVMESPSF